MNRYQVCVVAALAVLTPPSLAHAQTASTLSKRGTVIVVPSGEIPTDQWVYEPLVSLRVWVDFDVPAGSWRTKSYINLLGPARTAKEFATFVQKAVAKMDAPDGVGARDLALAPGLRNALDKLLAEFAPELGERGVDAAAARKRLAAIVRSTEQRGVTPFADVPPRHWAASSVARLSNAGIVIGFGDGSYCGGRP